METPYIIVENKIPFVQGLLEPYARVDYLPAQEITPEAVRDADALLVRTRNKCNASLLSGSKCQLVATATIGTDHIDIPWCHQHGIAVHNAPGCNAPAVAQYVLASLISLCPQSLSQCTLGIVGVGHVGKIVEAWARQLGMRVLLNDPPRQLAEGGSQWSSLQEIAEHADIVTFHTPLDDSTWHLADMAFFESLRRKPVIVNATRGPVVDNDALLQALDKGLISHAVIDCWENEHEINLDLLELCDVATPHIAGYSYEGKVRATRMVIDAVCRHFDFPAIEMPEKVVPGAASIVSLESISQSYDPLADTKALKSHPENFEALRNHYNLRHEVR